MTWCQKHEDAIHRDDEHITELQRQMAVYKYATAELDARVRIIDGKGTSIQR